MDDLLIVLPTLNERNNVRVMAERLAGVLGPTSYRIVYVDDDSTDGTRDELVALAGDDSHVSFIHRIGRSGLASAVIEGALVGQSRYIAVMDADLQHDEKLLPEMLAVLESEPIDIVIGSRFAAGSSLGDFAESRIKTSQVGIMLAHQILEVPVLDPLTGYFMMRRELFDSVVGKLQGRGFKILLDILHKAGPNLRFRELPFTFGTRTAGESKLDSSVGFEYLAQLFEAKFGPLLPLSIATGLALYAAIGLLMFLLGHLAVGGGLSLGESMLISTAMVAGLEFRLKLQGLRRSKRPKGSRLVRNAAGFIALALLLCSPILFALQGLKASLDLSDTLSWILACGGLAGPLLATYYAFPLRPLRTAPSEIAVLDLDSTEPAKNLVL